MKPKKALQLYSIRQDCEKDFLGTLAKVKEMGYEGVEFAGYYGVDAATLKQTLTDLELEVMGSHIGLDQLSNHFTEVVSYEKTIGNHRIILPYASFDTLGEWQNCFTEMKVIQEKLAAVDLDFYYHNHGHEFTQIKGTDILAEMLEAIPEIKLELDLYWIAYAGVDVFAWLQEHQKNVHLLHVKDQEKQEPFESTELGSGRLALTDYLKATQPLNIPWLVVEQEAFQKFTPLESAAIDAQVLQTWIEEVY